MNILVFQITTITALIILTIYQWILLRFRIKTGESESEAIWDIHSERKGAAKHCFWNVFKSELGLQTDLAICEGCYFMGNRYRDDVYVDSYGQRVRLYLNIQFERIYITVVKGCVRIDNRVFEADLESRIEIPEHTTIRIGDIDLQFRKRRLWN